MLLDPSVGLDPALVMVGVGLWAALLAIRQPMIALSVPASFLVVMAVGAAAGFAGIKLPLVEAAIFASVVVIGGLLIGAVRLPVAWAMAIVGLFALFDGYAYAVEAPESDTGGYILQLLAETILLQGLGLALGWAVRRLVGEIGLRALGGAVLAAGAFALITH